MLYVSTQHKEHAQHTVTDHGKSVTGDEDVSDSRRWECNPNSDAQMWLHLGQTTAEVGH